MSLRIVMFGDIVGQPGRRVVQQQIGAVRDRYEPDLVIANAENIAGGSGITEAMYQRLVKYGVDGITLGDHCFRQKDIVPLLGNFENMIRPANLPEQAAGHRWMRLEPPNGGRPLFVVTVLGRLFMNGPPADDPFMTVDHILHEFDEPDPLVLVEVHAEATSEKVALSHYLDGRVAAVVGTHTHIPTADAKILPQGTAYITDLGMTGPYDSVLGRSKERVMRYMTTAMPAQFTVAEGDIRLCGVFIEIDDDGKATRCERIEIPAELSLPPFA